MEQYGNSGVFSVSNLYVYASVPAAQNYFNYLDFYRDHSVSGGKGKVKGLTCASQLVSRLLAEHYSGCDN